MGDDLEIKEKPVLKKKEKDHQPDLSYNDSDDLPDFRYMKKQAKPVKKKIVKK